MDFAINDDQCPPPVDDQTSSTAAAAGEGVWDGDGNSSKPAPIDVGRERPIAVGPRAPEIEVLENFSMVAPGIYRSSFPKKKNYAFLKRLKIRSILFLAYEEYPDSHLEWMHQNGVQLLQHGVSGNKEPFVEIDPRVICNAMTALLDVRNHPVLIHCNKGKHRTGCLVGCLRKVMRWCVTSIFEEYRKFAGVKARRADQEFIELFNTRAVAVDAAHLPRWLHDEWIEKSLTVERK